MTLTGDPEQTGNSIINVLAMINVFNPHRFAWNFQKQWDLGWG